MWLGQGCHCANRWPGQGCHCANQHVLGLCLPRAVKLTLPECCEADSARVLHPGMTKHHALLKDDWHLLGWYGGGSLVNVHVHPQEDAQLLRACPCFRLCITLGRTNLPINKMAVMTLCYCTEAWHFAQQSRGVGPWVHHTSPTFRK